MAKNDSAKKKPAAKKAAAKPKAPKKESKPKAPKELTAAAIDALADEEAAAAVLEERGIEFNAEATLDELKALLHKSLEGSEEEDEDDEAEEESEEDSEDEEDDEEADEKPARPAAAVLGSDKKPPTHDAPVGIDKIKLPKDLVGCSVVAVLKGREEIRRYSEEEHGEYFAELAVMFASKETGRTVVACK